MCASAGKDLDVLSVLSSLSPINFSFKVVLDVQSRPVVSAKASREYPGGIFLLHYPGSLVTVNGLVVLMDYFRFLQISLVLVWSP